MCIRDRDDPVPQISHAEAARAFELSLAYVEQHVNATLADVLLLMRWWNIAASAGFTALHQRKMTDFVQHLKSVSYTHLSLYCTRLPTYTKTNGAHSTDQLSSL